MFAKGIMNGTGDKTFSPKTPLSRAMLVTILYRLDGEPASGWMYTINREFLGKGITGYIVKPGDKITLLHTLDQGRDIG